MKFLSGLFVSLLLLPIVKAEDSSMQRQGSELGANLHKSCGRPITVDMLDYAYGRDELLAYEYPGLEYCQRLISLLGSACEAHSSNAGKLVRVSNIFCQRGSIEGPRMILRKNGDLVLLAVNGREDWEEWMKQELTSKLKIDFNANEKNEIKASQEKKEEQDEKKREAEQKAKEETQQKKIEALTAWFQAEVQKLTAKPTPDMSEKLEKLSQDYQEKIDALTR
jgi:hypothetical protein